MHAALLGRALAVWLALIVAETLHGAARGLWLAPVVGEFRARQVAVFTGAVIVFAIVVALARWLAVPDRRRAFGIGALWVALTVAFEFVVAALAGYGPGRVLEDYDLSRGGLLGLGMAVLFASPWLASRLRGLP